MGSTGGKPKTERLGEERYNNQGYLMRIIWYGGASDIIVEFQDDRRGMVHTSYQCFRSGGVRNPYHPNVFGVGVSGNKYPIKVNSKHTKEYVAWKGIIERCYTDKYKNEHPTYKDAMVCNEWIFYENFYEWLHSQENFDKWLNGRQWNIDKDILLKGNKVYSPETCCLVPNNVNKLFIKSDAMRGQLPIGVTNDKGRFRALCNNPFTKKPEYLGSYANSIDAFQRYKEVKESYIKQVAQIEYDKGNITKRCYDVMMKYEVEMTD